MRYVITLKFCASRNECDMSEWSKWILVPVRCRSTNMDKSQMTFGNSVAIPFWGPISSLSPLTSTWTQLVHPINRLLLLKRPCYALLCLLLKRPCYASLSCWPLAEWCWLLSFSQAIHSHTSWSRASILITNLCCNRCIQKIHMAAQALSPVEFSLAGISSTRLFSSVYFQHQMPR